MIKIIDYRDAGKTKKLLEACVNDQQSVFVCKNPNRIDEKCFAYGLPKVDTMSYSAFLKFHNSGECLPAQTHVYIDDLEEFVKVMTNLQGYTLTI